MASICLSRLVEGVEGGTYHDIGAIKGDGGSDVVPPSRDAVKECEKGMTKEDNVIGEDASKARR